jgi:hypothetical protein
MFEPVEIQNPGRILRHFDHIRQDALQRLRNLLVIGTEGNPVRVESHHRVEQTALLTVVSLHLFIENAHGLKVHFD